MSRWQKHTTHRVHLNPSKDLFPSILVPCILNFLSQQLCVVGLGRVIAVPLAIIVPVSLRLQTLTFRGGSSQRLNAPPLMLIACITGCLHPTWSRRLHVRRIYRLAVNVWLIFAYTRFTHS